MERVAEILGEDLGWLMGIAIKLVPEDGCPTVFGPGEQWFYSLTDDGIDAVTHRDYRSCFTAAGCEPE